MWNALKAAKEWLLGAIGILGLIFSFLFFGSKPDSAISVVWAYAVVCLLLCLSVWLMGALLFALSQQRQTVARIQAVFSATGNPTIDLSFLLNPNDSFSSLMKCSVFYLEGSVELYIGGHRAGRQKSPTQNLFQGVIKDACLVQNRSQRQNVP